MFQFSEKKVPIQILKIVQPTPHTLTSKVTILTTTSLYYQTVRSH